jgi:hypothetical protein
MKYSPQKSRRARREEKEFHKEEFYSDLLRGSPYAPWLVTLGLEEKRYHH